ncbi:hypothetical protein EYC80_000239 [Monilinia laxa]|uniref:Uncharacterized protein n=1 Tax=Monilinia laxa TaxID=61186 RepID=A0A5N6KB30_MONLA|nr:hypothetical protein EYC80_000239 [Monilinia laxa]
MSAGPIEAAYLAYTTSRSSAGSSHILQTSEITTIPSDYIALTIRRPLPQHPKSLRRRHHYKRRSRLVSFTVAS